MADVLQMENIADALNMYFSGMGLRGQSREFQISQSKLYRVLSGITEEIYSIIIEGFRNSKLYNIPLEFGNVLEVDEKVIPVNLKQWRKAGRPISRFKEKKGHQVAEVIIENILDIKTHFCLVSEPLMNDSSEEIARAWLLAKERLGRWPVIIRCDNTLAHITAYKMYVPKQVKLEITPKIGEVSQLHLAEGYHKLLDLRKLDSGIHGSSLWILHGNWLHFNFVQRKANLNNRTPFEVAAHRNFPTENGWEFLLCIAEKVRNKDRKHEKGYLSKIMKSAQESLTSYFDF